MTDITPSRRFHSAAVLVGWVALLAAAWWFLRRLGHGSLAAPPLTSWSALGEWAEGRDEAEIVMALLRLVALGLVVYLLALSMLGSLLRLSARASSGAIDRVTPSWLVRILDSSLGTGLTAAAGVASMTFPSPVDPPPAVAEQLAEGMDPAHSSVVIRPTEISALVMMPRADDPPVMIPITAHDQSADAGTPDDNAPAPGRDRVWVAETGDHLWSIAVDTLADELDVVPSAEQVDEYWRLLVDHNRSRLLDPNNPDFIVPGQEFELPLAPFSR